MAIKAAGLKRRKEPNMRKEAKKNNKTELASVQSYHQGIWDESYAFAGFESNKYMTSDRYEELDENFHRPNGKPLAGVGFEIETESFGVTDERAYAEILKRIIFPLFRDDLFKMQHDGSLGNMYPEDGEEKAVGIECITQVMTKMFVRNNYRNFKAMYDMYFPAFNISCSKSGRCGMHVNISNALFGATEARQVEAIRKLYYFINKNFRLACDLFKRDWHKTHYCGCMDRDITIESAKEKEISGGSHYECMNFSHFRTGRIELRLVGGQANYYAFRNTVEVVFWLVERMRSIKWEQLDDMKAVFKGCNRYVYKRLQDTNLPDDVMDYIYSNLNNEDLELHD